MVTTKEKSVVDTQKSLVKWSKNMTTKVDQITTEDSKRGSKEQSLQNSQKTTKLQC